MQYVRTNAPVAWVSCLLYDAQKGRERWYRSFSFPIRFARANRMGITSKVQLRCRTNYSICFLENPILAEPGGILFQYGRILASGVGEHPSV